MNLSGFAGSVLVVDLSKGVFTREPLDYGLARDFIGGLGLSIKLAYDAITPGSEALDPKNPIGLGVGPLVGTDLPASSRVYAVTRLPSSRSVGWCGGGGVTFGCMLKNAGYDHIVITGRADRPVYLEILDDHAALCDASSLWGLGISATCEALWKKYPWPAGILAIGLGGENLVTSSMAYINRMATLGRGGFGAVMGSKNLKAIVVRGSKGLRVADRKAYESLKHAILSRIRSYPKLKEWQELGMLNSFPFVEKETYLRVKKRRVACVSCPIGCKDIVEIRDGAWKGLVAHSSSAVNLFTPMMYGMEDYRDAIKLIAELDDYGLDMFEFLGIMSFARDLWNNGLISGDLLDQEIRLDSLQSMSVWAGKIARREGLGDLLADGFKTVVDAFGRKAQERAPALVKDMHPYAGPGSALPWRLFGTMELGQVLDPRGPHVGSSGSPTYFAKRPLDVFPTHLARMGVPADKIQGILIITPDGRPQGLNIGALLSHAHRWFTILGSLGVCARAQINRFYSASFCAQAYEAVTGIETSVTELRHRAERAWTLLRMANVREGFSRDRYERLPATWFGDQGFLDYVTEEPLTVEQAEGMIDDYFLEWGWDPKSGVPTPECLQRLGLDISTHQ